MEINMNCRGKAQLTIVIDSPAELEAEGDRIFAMHEPWMKRSHYRQGDKALLQYNVAKAPGKDGRVFFVLTEVYETAAGIADHIAQAQDDPHHDPFVKWMDQCQVTFIGDGVIFNSLW